MIASAFHLYPMGGFGGRLLVFALPVLILGSAMGWQAVTSMRPWVITATLAVVVFVPVLKLTVRGAQGDTRGLRQAEQLRPLIAQLQKEARPGDHVYVFNGGSSTFAFYADSLGYLSGRGLQVTVGTVSFDRKNVDAGDYERDLDPLNGKGRVWIVYSNAYWRTISDEEMVLAAARKRGTEVSTFLAPGASVRLFTFD